MRIDVWDIKKEEETVSLDCGYPRDFDDHFTVDRGIGKGGFGLVKVVIEKATGREYACKSIKKQLDVPNISPAKLAQHLDNIDREAKILKRLRGTLSVVHFRGAWENDTDVHLVMEYCRGGELHHSIGRRVYTEAMVASYMRSVLHTLAQCHSHRILHRDVKPGNFMLLSDEEGAPLKAIDFGLAAFYEPEQLPRTDLGLDGTPWFMAPEVLNSQTFPASDVWSAGVMAYQLLSGYLPFDDTRNPNAPALSIIWKGILTEEPSFRRSAWTEVSPEAKEFVKLLLNKDHEQRPSAKEALKHPWLQTSFHAGKKRPLNATVVQRIQRFAQTNILRRTILELMANELLKMAPPRLSDPSLRGGGAFPSSGSIPFPAGTSPGGGGSDGPTDGGGGSSAGNNSAFGDTLFPMSPEQGSALTAALDTVENNPDTSGGPAPGSSGLRPTLSGGLHRYNSGDVSYGGRTFARSPSMQQIATLARAASRKGAATVHGPGDYWRILRQASELAAIGSGHGQMNYLRAVPRSEEERQEQRKAARLSLDTSAHGGGKYAEILAKFEAEGSLGQPTRRKVSGGMRMSASVGSLRHPDLVSGSAPSAPIGGGGGGLSLSEIIEKEEKGEERGSSVPNAPPAGPLFPQVAADATKGGGGPSTIITAASESGGRGGGLAPMDTDVMEGRSRGRSLAFLALQAGGGESETAGLQEAPPLAAVGGGGVPMETTFEKGQSSAAAAIAGAGEVRTVKRVTFNSTEDTAPAPPAPMEIAQPAGGRAPLESPFTLPTSGGPENNTADLSNRGSSSHSGPITNPRELEGLMRRLNFRKDTSLSKEALADGLRQLGYDLAPSEVAVLIDQLDLDKDEEVDPAGFIASQMDWGVMQRSNRDLWLECARRAFADLDVNSDGKLTTQDLMKSLRDKLPAEEVDFAVEDAMLDAGGIDPDEIDFEGFLKMLHVGSFESLDSLDQYDDRLRRTSFDVQDSSLHGGLSTRLETVPEDQAQK